MSPSAHTGVINDRWNALPAPFLMQKVDQLDRGQSDRIFAMLAQPFFLLDARAGLRCVRSRSPTASSVAQAILTAAFAHHRLRLLLDCARTQHPQGTHWDFRTLELEAVSEIRAPLSHKWEFCR